MGDVAIYGGFDGTESQLYQRDTSNTTILSGDVDSVAGNSGNAYHVVSIVGDGTSTTNACIIDGFIITGGNADNLPQDIVRGGGISIVSASPVIRNNLLKNNNAYTAGGALYLNGQVAGMAPRVERCSFERNTALTGGAIAVISEYSLLEPVITNSIFLENSAAVGGAASHERSFSHDCNPTLL